MGKQKHESADELSFTYQALTKSEMASMPRSDFEAKSNISDKTSDNLADFARSNDTYVILRPVNPVAFSLMGRGAVGKSMHVHGKSAEKGPAMGLIPTRSSISKAGKDNNTVNIAKFNQENTDSVHHATEALDRIKTSIAKTYGELKNSGKDVDVTELVQKAGIGEEDFKQVILPVSLKDKHGNQIYIFENKEGIASQDEKTKDHVYAIKQGDKFIRIDENHERIGEIMPPKGYNPVEVQVFGQADIKVQKDGSVKVEAVKPITADIDALAYGTKLEQGFDGITGHKEMLAVEKRKIIERSGVKLNEKEQKQLIENPVADVEGNFSPKSGITKIIDSLRGKSEMPKLLSDLKRQEVLMDHLRGMGEGTDVTHAITGQLRSEFKDSIAISHGSEQFNLNFTQGLDKEWIVKPSGEKSVVKGEQQLVDVFNEARQKGHSMPPNPNWGWKLDQNGKFQVEPEHKKMFDDIAKAASVVGPDNSKEQQNQMKGLLATRLELGKLAVTSVPPENQEKITSLTGKLKNSFESYQKNFAEPSKNMQNSKIKPSLNLEKMISKSHSTASAMRKSFESVSKSFGSSPVYANNKIKQKGMQI